MTFNNTTINSISANSNDLYIELTTDDIDNRPIYITGNFNNWCTQESKYVLEQVGDTTYRYKFSVDFTFPETLQYKFTKGDWNAVEISEEEESTPNRSTNLKSGVQREHVVKWKREWSPYKPNFLPQVVLLSDEFTIPQLETTRKIWALLPHNYDNTTDKYPVIYLQDAQNLFHNNEDLGNWEIDKKLAVMAEHQVGNVIIIAVEHAGDNREQEYSANTTSLGKGKGREYLEFLVETLKPYVDNNFRTKTDVNHTGIGGSSMGALISLFGGLLHPTIFGRLLIFSPALLEDTSYGLLEEVQRETKIYLYVGGQEGEHRVGRTKQLENHLLENKFITGRQNFNLSFNANGEHNETYWSKEFPKAIEWLFF
ncbi:alpha/beta hydrolase [Flavobacterium algicola]|uniref:alpha/beta hydrolase n=1 Tax=Flavobacterium algicola TaxID=556529 RepID=UPI001EFEDC8F|nr:alpha/beta hydrolase-fold protein [Flavobacterium algicola]MCG9792753.1 carbohydrate esterase [Flavobacterium algicola]